MAEKNNIDFTVYEYPINGYEDYVMTIGGYPHNPILFSSYYTATIKKTVNQIATSKQLEGDEWFKELTRDKAAYDSVFLTPMGNVILESYPIITIQIYII